MRSLPNKPGRVEYRERTRISLIYGISWHIGINVKQINLHDILNFTSNLLMTIKLCLRELNSKSEYDYQSFHPVVHVFHARL